jgi:hypothetical protein
MGDHSILVNSRRQIPTLIASRDPGLVVNHFDSSDVIKNYQHLFGDRTGLQQFYSNPFRAAFNDSYEFRSDRHYALDFISSLNNAEVMTSRHGSLEMSSLDITTMRPLLYFQVQNLHLFFQTKTGACANDYDLTVGELLQQEFIKASDHWMEKRGLLHRTQAYGVKMDVIAASGSADIPEAEQLFAKGSEGFIKLVTSGAHLYDRPVTTQESFVFFGRSEMTTPQKIKALSDKAFTCGINQIIYSAHRTNTRLKIMEKKDGIPGQRLIQVLIFRRTSTRPGLMAIH